MANSDIISMYSGSQSGGELPYFIGKQYGSGWLRTIGRFALPILKRIGSFGMKTAKDVIMNEQKILLSLKTNALAELGKVLPGVAGMFQKEKPPAPAPAPKRKRHGISRINKRMKGHGTIFAK